MDMFHKLLMERLQQYQRDPGNLDPLLLSLLLRGVQQYEPDNTDCLNALANIMYANNMFWEGSKLARRSHEIRGNPQANELLRRLEYPPFPANVTFEVSTVCNLRCPLCEYGTGNLQRPQKFMDAGEFAHAWSMLRETTRQLILVGYGETFLNPQIYEMLDQVPEQVYVYIDTNGNADLDCERLVRSGVNEMVFAVDGVDQESYERYRVGGKLERVLANIRNLIDAKRKLGSTTPLVTFKFILFKHTEMHVQQAMAMARELQVDRVRVEPCHAYPHFGREAIDRFAPLTAQQRIEAIDFQHQEVIPTPERMCLHCTVPYTMTVITVEGDVIPCCSGKVEHIVLGNVMRDDFKSIWHSPAARSFRRKVLENRWREPGCRVCSETLFHFGKFLDGTCCADATETPPRRESQWRLRERRLGHAQMQELLESGREAEAEFFRAAGKAQ